MNSQSGTQDGWLARSSVAADKGYHKAELLAKLRAWGVRTYVAERKDKGKRRWRDKPEGWQEALYGNRRRCKGKRGKGLQRRRSELVERSFAQVCESGGGRRTWIRGIIEVAKRYLLQVAGLNLGLIMRVLFGVGKPRALQGLSAALWQLGTSNLVLLESLTAHLVALLMPSMLLRRLSALEPACRLRLYPYLLPA